MKAGDIVRVSGNGQSTSPRLWPSPMGDLFNALETGFFHPSQPPAFQEMKHAG